MRKMEAKPYWNSYLGGLLLGLLLFLSFWLTGNGLGSSGGVQRILAAGLDLVAPTHVDHTPYWAKLAGGTRNPLDSWLVIEIVGLLAGGFLSGWLRGRVRVETRRGPRISPRFRWMTAFAGGLLMGFGARLARGCTSGQALSGGSVLSVGSWAFMFSIFIGAYALAWFMRGLWQGDAK